jgi:rhodanese-related sulfurtransferase
VSQQPVALDILFLLGRYAQNIKTGLHVNAIYKELVALGFSRNKNPVIKNINYLEQSGLLETTMCGEQKTIKTLTPLGHEFVKLANDFDKYVQSCSELQDTLDHNFGIENYSDKKVQRSILHNKVPAGPNGGRKLAVVCGSGYRSTVAASVLAREGYENLVNVAGGMTAWQAADH